MDSLLISNFQFPSSVLEALSITRWVSWAEFSTSDAFVGGVFNRVFCLVPSLNSGFLEDLSVVSSLAVVLETCLISSFFLFSSLEIYSNPVGVDESSPIILSSFGNYAASVYQLESFVTTRFSDHHILRFPSLVEDPSGLVHCFSSSETVSGLYLEGYAQFYSLQELPGDVARVAELQLSVLNVACESFSLRELVLRFFPSRLSECSGSASRNFDVRSLHWRRWPMSSLGYLYCKERVLFWIDSFLSKA